MQGKTPAIFVAAALLIGSSALTGCGSNSASSKTASAGGSTPTATAVTAAASATRAPDSGSASTNKAAPPGPPGRSSASNTPNGPNDSTGGTTSTAPVLIVRGAAGDILFDGRQPNTIAFSGDSSNIVTNLTWTSWGPTTAIGHGTWGDDNCQPNCAAGRVIQVPATIRLSDVLRGHFTAATEQAKGLDHTYRYPSDWLTGASSG